MIDIHLTGLVKEFEVGKRILDGFSLQIDEGERVGLLGRNGAGKTTIFRMMTGQVHPDEGAITIAPGKRLGLISQIPVYPEGYTVRDVLDTVVGGMGALSKAAKPSVSTLNNATNNSSVSKVVNFNSEINQEFHGDAAAQQKYRTLGCV